MKKKLIRTSLIYAGLAFSSMINLPAQAGLEDELALAHAIVTRHQPNSEGHSKASRSAVAQTLDGFASIGPEAHSECRKCWDALVRVRAEIGREAQYAKKEPGWETKTKATMITRMKTGLQ